MSRPLIALSKALRGFYLGGVMQQQRRCEHILSGHIASADDEEFDCKYEAYFNRADIDGWEIRKAMCNLHGMDLIPDPKIITAALRACRRVNDFALAIRFLESVKLKCGNLQGKIYPWIVDEIRPTLDELGINTPEELGYDKPELHLPSVYN